MNPLWKAPPILEQSGGASFKITLHKQYPELPLDH